MSKKNRYRAASLTQQKADPNVQVVVGQTGVGQPAMMPRNMRAYIQEGYRASKTVFRVVGHISRAGAGIKWKHYTDSTKQREITSSPLLDLWNRPSPNVAGSAFREAMVAYYCLTGNNYLLGINASGNPKAKFDELYNLRPDLTKIHVTDNGPDYYEFGTFQPPRRYDPLAIMHNKLFAGNDDVYGLSPVEVAAMSIDVQKAGQKWNLGLLSNMARPGGAWVTDALLGDQEYKGLKKEIRDKFAGPRNAGETAILHGGVKWQSMSMSPLELDWLESDTHSDRDIAGIFFNFPLFLLGLADSTYQNQSEAKHALYTEIIFPINDMFEDSLNMWLTPRYGGYLGYDKEDVETIQERLQDAKARVSETASAQWQIGLTTFHEARAIQGKEELPGVQDFILLNNVPVFVKQLNEFVQASMDKVTAPLPPPQPMMIPPGGGTTVTEEDAEDGNTDPPLKAVSIIVDPSTRYRKPYRVKALDLSTTEQKQAYFTSLEAKRQRYEADYGQQIAEYFDQERKAVAQVIDSSDSTEGLADRIETRIDSQSSKLQKILLNLYQDVGVDVGSQVASSIGAAASGKGAFRDFIDLFGEAQVKFLLLLAGTKIKQISTTTLAKIRIDLTNGLAVGESIPQLAKRISALYLDQIIPNRSTVIARTEVVAASNYGSQEAAKSSGLILKKVWLATSDSRTRPDHADADGQTVALDEPFEVGDSKMMYPGDNSLGAAANEIIQCRCTQYYERDKEAESARDAAEEADDTQKASKSVKKRVHRNYILRKYNYEHAANGQFGSGGESGGGGSSEVDGEGSGLSHEELSHVSGKGPIDGEHEHTVSVTLNGDTHTFTDAWVPGDVQQMLTSDYAYQFHGSDSALDDADIELRGHPDSVMLYSDAGKMTMFTNNKLETSQLENVVYGTEVKVDEHERASGKVGDYKLTDQYDPSDESVERDTSKSALTHSLTAYIQSLPGTQNITREQYRNLLRMKR